jgi:diacylglycerol kinase (ATP)
MPSLQPEKFSIKKRLKSFAFASKGFKIMIFTQHNAWIHTFAAVLVIALGLYFQITSIEWLFIILAIALVFAFELVNTALEFLVDYVSPEFSEKAGKIKDLAAAAVLVCAIAAAIIGVIIFVPYILELC